MTAEQALPDTAAGAPADCLPVPRRGESPSGKSGRAGRSSRSESSKPHRPGRRIRWSRRWIATLLLFGLQTAGPTAGTDSPILAADAANSHSETRAGRVPHSAGGESSGASDRVFDRVSDDASGALPEHAAAGGTTGQFWRVVLMQDYNTRVVLLGTLLLGVSAGTVGTFMLLRKRSLVGDVVGHASLPGIAVAFLIMDTIEPGSGKSLIGLLTGAAVAGALGILCTVGISRYTRIKEDAALAIVLSVFFGVGIALFTIVQNIPSGSSAGLNHFIFGKTASLVASDVAMIAKAAAAVLVLFALLFKELSLLCFDEQYAATQGWPVLALDLSLMGLVVGVSVIGLQSVGLLLVVALLIIPAAAARFWTDDLRRMTYISAAIGGMSAYLGVLASALLPKFAAGPVIVLVGAGLFLASLLFGPSRGVIRRILVLRTTRRRVGRHDLLRCIYELLELALADAGGADTAELTQHIVGVDQLLEMRSWTPVRLKRLLSQAVKDGLVRPQAAGAYQLSEAGSLAARRAVRNHRLWEMYLIHHADIAPSHVDRDADAIEHVLDPEVVDELDLLLSKKYPEAEVPPSPHPIEPAAPAAVD